jgi:hypothetical protein
MKLESSFFKKLRSLSLRRSSAPRPLINPAREWGVSLFVVSGIALCVFAYAGLDFYRQYNDSDMPIVSEESIPRYREQDAAFLIRYYEGREETFEKLRSDKPYIPPAVLDSAVIEGEAGGVVAGEEIGG